MYGEKSDVTVLTEASTAKASIEGDKDMGIEVQGKDLIVVEIEYVLSYQSPARLLTLSIVSINKLVCSLHVCIYCQKYRWFEGLVSEQVPRLLPAFFHGC